ncbi:MAG: DUF4884 domain-containing protein [Candidatus Pseudobacter hemicellulosilyticus]|uniref:DUF4884 domain-containing protein n=1 Tax=Candidatus Pseudobacter hemicellulosilyticus TaxID=3121375 RepID=A0AAJ5WU87_9BACT|nr:MAG: DUF4884 domain-containing protein [Pseudobacter sp.]
MKLIIPLSLLCGLTSCISNSRPLQIGPSQNNQTYTVEYLFTHDGCKVYRFYDRGNYVYFTNCNGEAIAYDDSVVVSNRTIHH